LDAVLYRCKKFNELKGLILDHSYENNVNKDNCENCHQ